MNDRSNSALKPEAVKEQIVETFVRRARADAGQIKVEVRGDDVVLRGHVPTDRERNHAEEAAWAIAGVDSVVNELEVVGEESDFIEL